MAHSITPRDIVHSLLLALSNAMIHSQYSVSIIRFGSLRYVGSIRAIGSLQKLESVKAAWLIHPFLALSNAVIHSDLLVLSCETVHSLWMALLAFDGWHWWINLMSMSQESNRIRFWRVSFIMLLVGNFMPMRKEQFDRIPHSSGVDMSR